MLSIEFLMLLCFGFHAYIARQLQIRPIRGCYMQPERAEAALFIRGTKEILNSTLGLMTNFAHQGESRRKFEVAFQI